MQFYSTSGAPAKQKTACAIVGIFEKKEMTAAARELDEASGGMISELLDQGDLHGRAGETLLVPLAAGLACRRLLMVGLGPSGKFDAEAYRKALTAALVVLARTGAREALSFLSHEPVQGADPYYAGRSAAEALFRAIYRFDKMKSGRKKPRPALARLGIGCDGRKSAGEALRGAEQGKAIALGMGLTRDLANLPANVCTPSYLAKTARQLSRQYGTLTARVLSEPELRKLQMGALLSVTHGTKEPAKLIVLRYRGADAKTAPVVLVGKGVTFDAGGISLKPPLGMDEMKFDMTGAAAVLGTIKAVAELGLPINAVGVIPACENLPGGLATKPGDIVRTMSGKTVEILNTDAEGRLILCDALTYAHRFKPALMIDVATLTGACVIALGAHLTGLMSNDDELAESLLSAGARAGDRAWRMPLAKEYGDQLKSNFADFANVGGREGGAVTAACFLSRFTEGTPWAHLDIAGTAWKGGARKGSTGRPVPLLVDFLLKRAATGEA